MYCIIYFLTDIYVTLPKWDQSDLSTKKRENNLRVIVLDNGAEKARHVNISFQFIL